MSASESIEEIDLRRGFATFVAAARRLEESHARLRARAEAVDRELGRANRTLERTLRERERVLAALPVGVLAADSEGATQWINPEGERLAAAARAAGLDPLTLEEGDVEAPGLVLRVRRAELPDGGRLVVLEDRTRLAGLEREVRRLDRLAGLSELALGVAHEIKNPLNGAMGFAQLLQRSEDPAAMRRHAERVVEGLRQVDAIVKALLAFAQPKERIARRAPLGDLVLQAAAAAGVAEGRIVMEGVHAAEASAAVVPVLANLLRNSVEAAGARARVWITVEAAGERLCVEVRDNGPGVAGDLGERVFEPFVSSKERGTGLGLAVAARVAGYLGGSLELCNPGEPGARFRLLLPLQGGDR